MFAEKNLDIFDRDKTGRTAAVAGRLGDDREVGPSNFMELSGQENMVGVKHAFIICRSLPNKIVISHSRSWYGYSFL